MRPSHAWRAGLALAMSVAGSIPAHAAATVIELRGVGVQVYACQPSPQPASPQPASPQPASPQPASDSYAWRLVGPDASLRDGAGVEVGRHFAGPSWRAQDGSTVVGELMVSSPAPRPGSIPWLLLRARSHAGQGVFASVGYIARTRTQGGLAPATGCDRSHAGREDRVPYQADYLLFPQP